MSYTEERRMILRARAGDQGAFEALYRTYFHRVYAAVAQRTRDRDEVEDLVQVAFMRAFQGLGTFRGEAAFSTWLTRIARNVCNSHYQMRRAQQKGMDRLGFLGVHREGWAPVCYEDPEEAMYRKECRKLVAESIQTLPARCRDAMWLRYVKDYSYTEIEAELQVPMGTVKTWLWRGRQLLKGAFQESDAPIM